MEKKHKVYLKLNILSLFFLGVSFISISLAWFAYSGLAKVATDIDVKTWYVEFQKNGEAVSNEIVISLSDIHPGMDTVYESVKILNKGDTDAKLSYSIVSASILNDSYTSDSLGLDALKDKISHDYPFKINVNLSKNFILSHDDYSMFDLSVSWPFDSGNDALDTEWGMNSYNFQKSEAAKAASDPSYQVKPSIKIIISVKAEQLTDTNDSPDVKYPAGKTILYDVSNNRSCTELSGTCIRTHVIDTDNKLGDTSVNLLPDLFETYPSGTFDSFNSLLGSTTSSWSAPTREMTIDDLVKLISSDVTDSIITSDRYSSTLVGYAKYGDRVNYLVNKAITYQGHFSFLNESFDYLATNKCYWVNREYDSTHAFALTKTDEVSSKLYGADKSTSCGVVPIIVAPKANIQN